jgi:hypothetical protein
VVAGRDPAQGRARREEREEVRREAVRHCLVLLVSELLLLKWVLLWNWGLWFGVVGVVV